VEVRPPAFLYVFWIDETGVTTPAYPWRFSEWKSRPKKELPIANTIVQWPPDKPGIGSIEIQGDVAGTETVIMLARPTPLEASDAEIQNWFQGIAPIPFLGEKAVTWFENYDVLRSDQLRAPRMADPGKTGGPLDLQRLLRQKLGRHFAFSRAQSFSRLGKQKEGP
jgi:hypothetical protein